MFDIQSAIDAILESDGLVETQGLPPNKSRFDVEDNNGLFDGDGPKGVTLTGHRALLVQGSLLGASGNACRIQVEGDVIITGNVRHAQIQGGNIYIAGTIQHTRLISTKQIKIGADLVHSQLTLGDNKASQRQIEELQHAIGRALEERESLDRQRSQDEKRMHRSSRTTSTPLNFNIGQYRPPPHRLCQD